MHDARPSELEHALNTPLARVRLALQLLRRGGGLGRRQAERIGIALMSLDELTDVAGAILRRAGDVFEQESRGDAPVEKVSKPHIAVVNDDTIFLRLMDELLGAEEGYRVSTSYVGSEGHRFVKDLQPDLVILDLVFGNRAEEGWRTLDLLTLDPATRRIPVIVCSAATLELERHGEWLRGFDVEVLRKPFDLDALLASIEATLGARRSPRVVVEVVEEERTLEVPVVREEVRVRSVAPPDGAPVDPYRAFRPDTFEIPVHRDGIEVRKETQVAGEVEVEGGSVVEGERLDSTTSGDGQTGGSAEPAEGTAAD